jgi:hypothetical protein
MKSIEKITDIAEKISTHKFSRSEPGQTYLDHIPSIHSLMEELFVPIDNHSPAGVPLRLLKGICIAMEDILFWENISKTISDLNWVSQPDSNDIIRQIQGRYKNYDYENYKYSFTNPVQSCALLGDDPGRYFCAFFYAVTRMHYPAVKKRTKIFRAARAGCHEIVKKITEYLKESCKNGVKCFESSNFITKFTEIVKNETVKFMNMRSLDFVSRIDEAHVPTKNFENKILDLYEKTGINALNCRPWKEHSEALKVTEIFQKLSDTEVSDTARELLAGFKRSADVAGIEIKKGDIYNFHYAEGMERLVLELRKQTRALGLDFKGLCTPIVKDNHQELYDHKNDFHISLSDQFIAEYVSKSEKEMTKISSCMKKLRGNIVVEFYGEDLYSPVQHDKHLPFIKEGYMNYQKAAMGLSEKFQPPGNMSFSICALPHPHIGPDIDILLKKSLGLITLPLDVWAKAQQKIVELLDRADYVRVKGCNASRTDIKVSFYKGHDIKKQTAFCSVLADLNFPVGEVFTTPRLEETNGLLHIPGELFFDGLPYKDFFLKYEKGRIADYGCTNFDDPVKCKEYIEENLFDKKTNLPMGEFAIGTNKILDKMVREHNIPQSKLSVLLIEKMGPHFAFGDTCYTMRETQNATNPDGREITARCNEISDPASGKPAHERYFFVHVDVTLPYQYTGSITAYINNQGKYEEIDIVRQGRFVLEGTQILNVEDLDDPRLNLQG